MPGVILGCGESTKEEGVSHTHKQNWLVRGTEVQALASDLSPLTSSELLGVGSERSS